MLVFVRTFRVIYRSCLNPSLSDCVKTDYGQPNIPYPVYLKNLSDRSKYLYFHRGMISVTVRYVEGDAKALIGDDGLHFCCRECGSVTVTATTSRSRVISERYFCLDCYFLQGVTSDFSITSEGISELYFCFTVAVGKKSVAHAD